MVFVNCKRDEQWLVKTLSAVEAEGFCVVEDVLNAGILEQIRPAMYRTQERILAEIGQDRLKLAGELGVLRIMLKFDPVFFGLLERPEVLAVVDATVSPTAILHHQNGFILPSFQRDMTPKVFQNSFHRDFPRNLNGYLASINTLFAVDRFTHRNGATFVIPGSHRDAAQPSKTSRSAKAIAVECAEGSMLVFDSTLWHAGGVNTSGRDRLAINQQFTRSWIKQQIDYVRALGDETVRQQTPRTQQLLGYYTRVVTSLDEYYRPEDQRVYRKEQG